MFMSLPAEGKGGKNIPIMMNITRGPTRRFIVIV